MSTRTLATVIGFAMAVTVGGSAQSRSQAPSPSAVTALPDVVGIVREHWWYSERYTTGILLPLDVPIEELVFFVVIPICGLLTYEAVGTVLGRVQARRERDA